MITTEMVSFLRDLEADNTKAWFDENRKRYEKLVRDPFRAFCGEIVRRLKETDATLPGLTAAAIASIPDDPRDGIMRINRDLRFSRDKTPYHTYLRAAFVPGGRKSGNAGLYLTVEPDSIGAGGGIYRTGHVVPAGTLPRLESAALDPEYRESLEAAHEEGVKKGGSVVAIVSLQPQRFVELPDQISWIVDRFREVSPLIGALQEPTRN